MVVVAPLGVALAEVCRELTVWAVVHSDAMEGDLESRSISQPSKPSQRICDYPSNHFLTSSHALLKGEDGKEPKGKRHDGQGRTTITG
jgi:hypothetical protein